MLSIGILLTLITLLPHVPGKRWKIISLFSQLLSIMGNLWKILLNKVIPGKVSSLFLQEKSKAGPIAGFSEIQVWRLLKF
jgi:hypothetical protein